MYTKIFIFINTLYVKLVYRFKFLKYFTSNKTWNFLLFSNPSFGILWSLRLYERSLTPFDRWNGQTTKKKTDHCGLPCATIGPLKTPKRRSVIHPPLVTLLIMVLVPHKHLWRQKKHIPIQQEIVIPNKVLSFNLFLKLTNFSMKIIF